MNKSLCVTGLTTQAPLPPLRSTCKSPTQPSPLGCGATVDSLVSAKDDYNPLKPALKMRKPGLISFGHSIFWGAQGAAFAAAISTAPKADFGPLLGLVTGVGAFFYKIGDFINSLVKLCKKPNLLRLQVFFSNSVNITSSTISACVAIAREGLIVARTTLIFTAQITTGVLNLAASLLSCFQLHTHRVNHQNLQNLDVNAPKEKLVQQIKDVIHSSRVLRQFLKDIFTTPRDVAYFNEVVEKSPKSTLALLQKVSRAGFFLGAASLGANVTMGIGGLIGMVNPLAGFALAITGGIIFAAQWIASKLVAKSIRAQLREMTLDMDARQMVVGVQMQLTKMKDAALV